jgi:polyhydroxybutyrate depolymerase
MKKKLIVLGLALALLAACRFASETTPTVEVQATGETISSTASPIDETIAARNYALSLGSENDTRDVIVHIPPAYDGSLELPLLIVLHGGAGNGSQIQRLTELDADADEYGFIVAYPDGSGRLGDSLLTWNSGHCCGYALENDVDDVAFIDLLIDRLISHYAVDPSRVYLAGISNGGMMAYRAGAELADKVAGIAPIAGSIGGRITENGFEIVPGRPGAPVSVIAFHGMQDQHVLYEGGIGPEEIIEGRVDISVYESINFWLDANDCDLVPETGTQAEGNIVIDTYGGCEGGTAVVLVTIVDGGHAWPGASRGLVSDQPTQDISANEMMLEFFLAHPKR